MKLLVHDYAGHPFQAQLSRELSRRGHDVVHSSCAAYASGKGRLQAEPGEHIRFEPIGVGSTIAKTRFRRRVFQELGLGLALARQIRRERPDAVMVANTPVPTLVVMALVLFVRRTPWVLWHQDVQAVAIRSFAGTQLSPVYRWVAAVIEVGERWCARRAAAVVVIADGFMGVHRKWGTDAKTHVIPNWAPLDEIVPVERKNDWAVDHRVDDVKTLLYSGTLGLKHNPALLPKLARAVVDRGVPVRLVVVNEGPAAQVVADEAERLGVDLELLPFQPYEDLPDVLGSGDILVVLLEQSAGEFSVPSKTLSYLCAGRPVLGMMPSENLAAGLVERADGKVLPPLDESVGEAADWACALLEDQTRRDEIGERSRQLAEDEFALEGCADRFETILAAAASR